MRRPPRPRSFPSILPLRETLTLTSPKSPQPFASLNPSPASLPPPFHRTENPSPIPTISISSTIEIEQTPQIQTPQQTQIQQQQQQIQQRKKSEEEEKKGVVELLPPVPPFLINSWVTKFSEEERKKLLFEHKSVPEKSVVENDELKKTVESFEHISAKVKKNSEWEKFFEHTSGLTKKYYQSGSIAYKDPKKLTLLFEQKLEIELSLIEYVDSPPTSDVSTIRGRIVFKKGRMIPYTMGLDRGRTRPPRARLKDRDPPLLFRLC